MGVCPRPALNSTLGFSPVQDFASGPADVWAGRIVALTFLKLAIQKMMDFAESLTELMLSLRQRADSGCRLAPRSGTFCVVVSHMIDPRADRIAPHLPSVVGLQKIGPPQSHYSFPDRATVRSRLDQG